MRLENPDFAPEEKAEGPLAGMTFVITGTLPAARKEVEELIERHGGHAASQVSASTDYLIVGEDPGSKQAKAERLGVKTITYTDLLGLTGKRAKRDEGEGSTALPWRGRYPNNARGLKP